MATGKIYLESNTEGLQSPVALPVPFCATPTAGEKTTISTTALATEPSIPLGFPSVFDNPTAGGQYVSRPQMNGFVNLMTINESRKQQGGINTFNPALVAITGGYSKGAVLDWWDAQSGSLKSVISLKDGNQVDFTSNGPDGINWVLCSQSSPVFPAYGKNTTQIIAKFANITLPSAYGWVSGTFEMPFDGYVICPCSVDHKTTAVRMPFLSQASYKMTVKYTFAENWLTATGSVSSPIVSATITSPVVISAESYTNQRHEVFLAICDADEIEPSVDMENIGSGNNNCTIHMVSSSGQDGGGAPGPLIVAKGSVLRLFGRQGYSERSQTEALPSAQLETLGEVFPVVERHGELVMSLRVVAYPVGA